MTRQALAVAVALLGLYVSFAYWGFMIDSDPDRWQGWAAGVVLLTAFVIPAAFVAIVLLIWPKR